MKIIKELLERPEPFTAFKEEEGFIYSFFSINTKEYIVVFHIDTRYYAKAIMQMYHADFSIPFTTGMYSFAFGLLEEDFDKDNVVEMLMNRRIIDVTTGSGDVYPVITTVAHAVVNFFSLYDPNMVYFGAQEENRYKIYRFLSRELVKRYPNYKFDEVNHMYIIHKKLEESKNKKMNLKLLEAVNYEFYKDKIHPDTFEMLLMLDPTPNKTYGRWIVETYLKIPEDEKRSFLFTYLPLPDPFPLPDYDYINYTSEALTETLKIYDELKKNKLFPADKKDIMKFRSFPDLMYFIYNDTQELMRQQKKEKSYKDSNVIFENDNCIFLSPKTHDSACYFGDDTNWCTSRSGDSNYFNRYSARGKIYIYRSKDGEGGFTDETYENIQIFFPKDNEKQLAECRNHADRTIYAVQLWDKLPNDNKVIQFLKEKWETIPNSDQWPEGTGYLDPDDLHPEDEEEEEEEEAPLEELTELIRYSYYNIDAKEHSVYYKIKVLEDFFHINEHGTRVHTEEDSITEIEFITGIGQILTGKQFFYSREGRNALKALMEDVEDTSNIPSLFEHTLVINYDDYKPFSLVMSQLSDQYNYEDENEEINVSVIKELIKEMKGLYAVVVVSSGGNADLGIEPIYDRYLDTMYTLANENPRMMILAKKGSDYGTQISKEKIIVEYIDGNSSKTMSIGFCDETSLYFNSFDHDPLIQKLMKGEFIPDEHEEREQGQQFLNYEKIENNKVNALKEGQIKVLQKKGKNEYDIVDVINREGNSSMFGEKEVNYKGIDYPVRRHPKFKDCIIL